MPILPEYTWIETVGEIRIRVALTGANARKPVVTVTSACLKINRCPHLLQLDLYRDVCSDKAVVEVTDTGLDVRLPKKEAGLWHQLTLKEKTVEREQRRSQALLDLENSSAQAQYAHLSALDRLSKKALESKQARYIAGQKHREQRKNQQLEDEQKALNRWQGALCDTSDAEDSDDENVSKTDSPSYYGRGWQPSQDAAEQPMQNQVSAQIREPDAPVTPPQKENVHGKAEAPQSSRPRVQPASTGCLPKPARALHTVQVDFTPLQHTHMPAREARQEELNAGEQERDQLQLEANAPISDQHPVLLKDKAEKMLAAGNYKGAFHAFHESLQLDAKLISALLGRAKCQLHLRNIRACMDDCSRAIGLLQDKQALDRQLSPEEQEQLAVLNDVRAAAQDQQDQLSFLCKEEVDKQPAQYIANVDPLPMPGIQYSNTRADADKLLKSQKYDAALGIYNSLIEHACAASPPALELMALYSNRAVAHFGLQHYTHVVTDCTQALTMLLGGDSESHLEHQITTWEKSGMNASHQADDTNAGQRQAASMLRLLMRRAAAQAHMNRRTLAHEDFQLALRACKAFGLEAQTKIIQAEASKLARLH